MLILEGFGKDKYTFLSTKPDAAMKYTKGIKDVIRQNYALTS